MRHPDHPWTLPSCSLTFLVVGQSYTRAVRLVQARIRPFSAIKLHHRSLCSTTHRSTSQSVTFFLLSDLSGFGPSQSDADDNTRDRQCCDYRQNHSLFHYRLLSSQGAKVSFLLAGRSPHAQ